jgi:hypothetical protein
MKKFHVQLIDVKVTCLLTTCYTFERYNDKERLECVFGIRYRQTTSLIMYKKVDSECVNEGEVLAEKVLLMHTLAYIHNVKS